MQARAIGVEDPHQTRVDLVVAVIRGNQRFREALGFVVNGAGPDGIDMAPVFFSLRVLFRVSVALRRRSMKEFRFILLCNFEKVPGSHGAREESFNAEPHIVFGASRGGEAEDIIYVLRIEGSTDILLAKSEPGLSF